MPSVLSDDPQRDAIPEAQPLLNYPSHVRKESNKMIDSIYTYIQNPT